MQALLIRLGNHEREELDNVARRHTSSPVPPCSGRRCRCWLARRLRMPRYCWRIFASCEAHSDRAGVSLNQIARRFNASDAFDARTLGTVLTEIIQLNRDTRALLAALEDPRNDGATLIRRRQNERKHDRTAGHRRAVVACAGNRPRRPVRRGRAPRPQAAGWRRGRSVSW